MTFAERLAHNAASLKGKGDHSGDEGETDDVSSGSSSDLLKSTVLLSIGAKRDIEVPVEASNRLFHLVHHGELQVVDACAHHTWELVEGEAELFCATCHRTCHLACARKV